MKFKFAHIADSHIGAWRDPKMRQLSIEAFITAIDISIKRKVDFVLISGDLFNTAIPDIESIKSAVSTLNRLKKSNISCYIIPGSHDFSPNGKTFLDVIEEAGLVINTHKASIMDGKLKLKFTIDTKTGVRITGIAGRRGQLDRNDYEALDYTSIEKYDGFKIFMFHTTITELKPKSMNFIESSPLSFLPVGFDYYAGGHVHIVKDFSSEQYKNVIYPGPLFPNSFSELEKLKQGGFYIVEVGSDSKILKKEFVPIKLKELCLIEINADSMSIEKLFEEIQQRIKNQENEIEDAIVLLRIYGTLSCGKISDMNFSAIIDSIYNNQAYFVMRNTSKLVTAENLLSSNINLNSGEDIELGLVSDNLGVIENNFINESKAIYDIMHTASSNKLDGEKVYDYESRIISEIDTTIKDNKKNTIKKEDE